jgi:3-deoxy-D-manno-octulosonate 8-phosphate phosphatase (KDO 8-P phosphatase)
MVAPDFAARAAALQWLVCDVDGVLTDGRLYYGLGGSSREPAVAFDIKDGLALRLAQRGGLKVGVLSGRTSALVRQRAEALRLDLVITGRDDKGVAFRDWTTREGVVPGAVAYIGDDLIDLPILRACGLALAPADAADEVRAAAHVVLERPGGRGAVREAVRRILQARGAWDRVVAQFGAG